MSSTSREQRAIRVRGIVNSCVKNRVHDRAYRLENMDPLCRILHLTSTATTPLKNEPALAPGLRTAGGRSRVKGMNYTSSPPHLDLRAQ